MEELIGLLWLGNRTGAIVVLRLEVLLAWGIISRSRRKTILLLLLFLFFLIVTALEKAANAVKDIAYAAKKAHKNFPLTLLPASFCHLRMGYWRPNPANHRSVQGWC